ncbi:MAG: hypothetical protein JNL70_01505 [Saprospiraceae bacterium]|nr:hypothetical protein [Saprospiraceae bacterium]
MKKLICRSTHPLFLLLFFFALSPLSMFGQLYGTAGGLRIGNGIGLTLQQQVAAHTTVEGILQSDFTTKDVTLSVLGEQHYGILRRNLNFYMGAGFYKTWLATDANLIVQPTNPFGLSMIGGLELTLGKLNLSVDIKPTIKIKGDGKTVQAPLGVSARYVFVGRYFKDDDWKFWKKKR